MAKTNSTSENDYKRIDSYGAACKFLNQQPINEEAWKAAGVPQNKIDLEKLETITKAINGGVVMDLYDEDTWRWYPWFYTNGSLEGFAFGDTDCGDTFAVAGCGSRLAFLDEERAVYAGETFVDLYGSSLE